MAPWRIAFICLQWVIHYALCREVTVPDGPLYRVAGFPLTLPCAVTGYEGSRTQDFEWFQYRSDTGGHQIGVVSTQDPGFPYAPFQARVRSGEIRVERDSGDRARLVVQRLRSDDQGRFECYTPSTDTRYQGNYSASVVVKVIPDTLLISHPRTLSGQPMTEGSELQLTCKASALSQQHTHLAITFGVRGGAGAAMGPPGAQGHTLREIISLDRGLAVTAGRGGSYDKRYQAGEIGLEKRVGDSSGDLYVMKIGALAPEDSGSYFCEAAQWIRDPDGTWQRIAQRTMELGNLTVQPLADSLMVTSTPSGEVTLQVGSPLSLTCVVGGVGSWTRSSLLVQWMRRGAGGGVEVEVARLGPDGVVSWGDDSTRQGAASMEKEGEGKYILRRFAAYPSDAGLYRCAVSVYAGKLNPGPSDPATVTQRSEGVLVNVKTKDVSVAAVAEVPRGPLLRRGNTVAVLCNVSVTTTGPSQVEIQWLSKRQSPEGLGEKPMADDPGRVLALLTYDGLSRIYANGSELSVDRLAPDCYRLRIHVARVEDQGHYLCQVAVWGQDPNGAWYNTGATAESSTVRVYLYARVMDLLLIPLVIGVSSALFVGVVIIATVTCCFMRRLARQRSQK
ncbi:immunoglobulin superfamily member 8 [Alosa pseudoharengus]|uniref:immunoglobulin superfamily member 8 n=1 Tax=Alosa pseudoharengus TaxID=34774 RepID=UPI003F8C36E3